jgi:hypothetical protein
MDCGVLPWTTPRRAVAPRFEHPAHKQSRINQFADETSRAFVASRHAVRGDMVAARSGRRIFGRLAREGALLFGSRAKL